MIISCNFKLLGTVFRSKSGFLWLISDNRPSIINYSLTNTQMQYPNLLLLALSSICKRLARSHCHRGGSQQTSGNTCTRSATKLAETGNFINHILPVKNRSNVLEKNLPAFKGPFIEICQLYYFPPILVGWSLLSHSCS